MPLRFDCNLEQIASVAIVIYFWESPDIKSETDDFLSGIPSGERKCFSRWRSSYSMPHDIMKIQWKKISDKVVHPTESITLPGKIRRELNTLIHSVGQRILLWAKFVRISLNLDQKCLDKIFFTSVGTIDENKFFNILLENPSLYISDDEKDDTLTKNCKIYILACIFVQKDFIKDHLEEMRDVTESYFVFEMDRTSLTMALLIRVWISLFFSSNLEIKLESPNQKKPLAIYSDDILLDKCKSNGFVQAATYFALESAADETSLVKTIIKLPDNFDKFALFLQARYLEMILFILNQMSDEGKIDLISELRFYIFELWFYVWPYQELLLQMLNIFCENIVVDKCYTIFSHLTLESLIASELPWSSRRIAKLFLRKDKTQQQVIRKGLQMIPKKWKREWVPLWIIRNLEWFAKERDLSTIAIIFDDDDVKHLKKELIDAMDKSFVKIIEQTNFEFIDDFLNSANFTVEETKTFKNEHAYLIERFAKDGKFDLVEKLLNWLYSNSSKDKTEWIKQKKSEIWSEELLSNAICKIWGDHCHSSTEKAKTKCSEFLEWFSDLESEEIKAFDKEKLIKDENFLGQFCDNLHFAEDLKTIDEFFEFCSLSSDKIKEIKGKIRENADHWIHLLGIEKNDFRVANAVVNWISENENEKKEIIEKFLNSSKGVELFCKVLELPFRMFLIDPVLIFLNEWVKPYGDFSKIKQIVGTDWEDSVYKYLLDELENNGCISKNDIEFCIYLVNCQALQWKRNSIFTEEMKG